MSGGPHLLNWEKNKIAKEIAAGKPISEIAEDNAIHPNTVYKVKKEKKELIEKEGARLLGALPDIVDQKRRTIQISNRLSKVIAGEGSEEDQKIFDDLKTIRPGKFGDTEDIGYAISVMELGSKEGMEVLKMAGIGASSAPSVMVQNIYNDNRSELLSPVLESILSKVLPSSATGQNGPSIEAVEVNVEEIIE